MIKHTSNQLGPSTNRVLLEGPFNPYATPSGPIGPDGIPHGGDRGPRKVTPVAPVEPPTVPCPTADGSPCEWPPGTVGQIFTTRCTPDGRCFVGTGTLGNDGEWTWTWQGPKKSPRLRPRKEWGEDTPFG
tara:strand:+ start:114 stop:503 length:390 start_codon:yes stop_codon:yes gene_type:complete